MVLERISLPIILAGIYRKYSTTRMPLICFDELSVHITVHCALFELLNLASLIIPLGSFLEKAYYCPTY